MLRRFQSYLVGVSLLTVVGCSPNKTAEEYVLSAKLAINDKHWSAAIVHLKNALRNVDKESTVPSGEIQFLMGQVQLSQGDMVQASRFLKQAISANVQLENSIPAYARALFHQGKYITLSQLINKYRNTLPAISLELTLYSILVLDKTGKSSQARMQLAALSDEAANSDFGLFTQAFIQTREDPNQALDLINLLLNQNAQYIDAYLLKGQLLYSQKRYQSAYDAFAHYLTLQPNEVHVHFLLAMSALQQGNKDIVQQHVTSLLKLNANHPLANHLQALLNFDKEEFQQAKAHSEKSIFFGLTTPINHVIAGMSALKLAQDEQAYQHLIKAASAMPDDQQVRKVLTLLQLKLGYLQDATENFESLKITNDAEFSLGNMLAAQLINDQHSGVKAILAKLQFAPTANPMLKLNQGIMQLQIGDNAGLATLKQVAQEKDASYIASISYIMALADAGNLNKALAQAKNWLKKHPKNVNAMNVIALLYQKNQQTDEAITLYKKTLGVDNNNVPALLFFAFQAAQQGNTIEASNIFIQVLAIVPNHSRAFAGLLRLTLEGTTSPNWAGVESIIQFDKPHNGVLQLLAQAMIQNLAYKQLNNIFETKTKKNTWSNTVWRLWLQTQGALNNGVFPEDAITLYLQTFQDTANQLFVISLLEHQQQFQYILDVIAKISGEKPLAIELLYAKANALLAMKEVKNAEFLISQLSKYQPLPAIDWLQGLLALQKNNVALAKQLLAKYFAVQPSLPGLVQLTQWALNDNDSQSVIELGERYLARFPNDNYARTLLFNRLLKKDQSAAIAFIDVPQSQSFIIHNWQVANNLAWLYLNGENKKRALKFSQYAYTKQPQNNNVALTHAVALLNRSHSVQALIVLESIKQPNTDIKQLMSRVQNEIKSSQLKSE